MKIGIILILFISVSVACKQQTRRSKHKQMNSIIKNVHNSKINEDNTHLNIQLTSELNTEINNELNYFDSTNFYNWLENLIVKMKNRSIDYPETYKISDEIYQMVFVDKHSSLPFSRKMDVLIFISFYKNHIIDELRNSVLIGTENKKIIYNKALLIPLASGYTRKSSILKFFQKSDTVNLNKEYQTFVNNSFQIIMDEHSNENNPDQYEVIKAKLNDEIRKMVFSTYFFKRYKNVFHF